MSSEQPEGDSGLLERLGNALAPEAPDEEAVEASPEVETQEEEVEVPEQPVDDGLVELELDGKVVRVDPELKDGYLRTADYTRKTQDLAALQKQAQAALEQQALVQQFNEETKEDQERLAQIKGELARYKKIDLTNLDTDQYIRTRSYLDQLKEEAGDIEKQIGNKSQAVQQKYQQVRNQAARHAQDYIQNHVKDWQPDSQVEREAVNLASTHGITRDVLAELVIRYPGIAVTLHKAAQYEKLQAAKGSVVQKAQSAPPVVKPGAVNPNQGVPQRYKKDREALKTSGSRDAGIRIFERLLSKG